MTQDISEVRKVSSRNRLGGKLRSTFKSKLTRKRKDSYSSSSTSGSPNSGPSSRKSYIKDVFHHDEPQIEIDNLSLPSFVSTSTKSSSTNIFANFAQKSKKGASSKSGKTWRKIKNSKSLFTSASQQGSRQKDTRTSSHKKVAQKTTISRNASAFGKDPHSLEDNVNIPTPEIKDPGNEAPRETRVNATDVGGEDYEKYFDVVYEKRTTQFAQAFPGIPIGTTRSEFYQQATRNGVPYNYLDPFIRQRVLDERKMYYFPDLF